MKLITFLFTILFTSLVSWNLTQAKCVIPKKKEVPTEYNRFVKINGEKMSYGIYGENNNQTIVLLPGINVLAPILMYKPFAEALSEEFKVIIVEPFGYGFSDISKKPRLIENIVKELHIFVHKLGLKKFYLSGHSMGGMYSLYYINKYPKDVLGFIGLDNTALIIDESMADLSAIEDAIECNKMYKNHTWAGDSQIVKDYMQMNLEAVKSLKDTYYDYSEKEINDYFTLFKNNYCNDNSLSESINLFKNLGVVGDMKFPKSIPSLQILSSQYSDGNPDWEISHHLRIYESPLNDIIIMEGQHFIMYDRKNDIVDEINKWVKKINNQKKQ